MATVTLVPAYLKRMTSFQTPAKQEGIVLAEKVLVLENRLAHSHSVDGGARGQESDTDLPSASCMLRASCPSFWSSKCLLLLLFRRTKASKTICFRWAEEPLGLEIPVVMVLPGYPAFAMFI